VRRALLVSRLPAARLEVEITETALMADPEQARSVLLELRRIGVTIALDDFGTGYSSLAYLATLPVDLVKIDRSFVIAMTRDPFVETIVVYILELCRALGVKTLAEGIETPEQAALLLRHGCNFGQGFLYAKGMTAREIVPRRYGPRLDVDRPAVAA
jgi:EAL domain-containing protein (putative c-di-GMP-specific phosphodiesterase class I)